MTRRRLVIAALVLVVLTLLSGAIRRKDKNAFVVKAQFANASGLRKDFFVKIGGVPAGKITAVGLDDHDHAVVTMRLDAGALPIGRDARATIRPSSLLGEHHVELTRGDVDHPARSGLVIPLARTATATELDQVLGALDDPTRTALGIFMSQSGDALLGRGRDIAAALDRLPPTLEEATSVIKDLGHDSAAFGALVDDSDRLVRPIAAHRRSLGRLIATADRALQPLAAGRADLGASIAGGPAALAELRRTLRRLRSLSRGVVPAADGLLASARPLSTTLRAAVPFAEATRPTLRELRRTAPDLRKLGVVARPTVARLGPVADRLDETVRAFEPTSAMLDRQIDTLLGYAEGYARAMARTDSLGHIYSTQTVFENLGDVLAAMRRREASRRRPRKATDEAPARRPDRPAGPNVVSVPPRAPDLPHAPKLPDLPALPSLPPPPVATPGHDDPAGGAKPLLDFLLKP